MHGLCDQVMVASSLASKMLEHQWVGIRDMWRNIVTDHAVSIAWNHVVSKEICSCIGK